MTSTAFGLLVRMRNGRSACLNEAGNSPSLIQRHGIQFGDVIHHMGRHCAHLTCRKFSWREATVLESSDSGQERHEASHIAEDRDWQKVQSAVFLSGS